MQVQAIVQEGTEKGFQILRTCLYNPAFDDLLHIAAPSVKIGPNRQPRFLLQPAITVTARPGMRPKAKNDPLPYGSVSPASIQLPISIPPNAQYSKFADFPQKTDLMMCSRPPFDHIATSWTPFSAVQSFEVYNNEKAFQCHGN